MDNNKKKTNDPAANPDPITKAPGAHPVGTGIGAAVGGAAAGIGTAVAIGATTGSVAGPVGAAVGAAIGAVAGGLIGKGAAEGVNPSVEHTYWRENYANRPYVKGGTAYEEYGPAYQTGWEARQQYAGQSFDEVENQLGQDWSKRRGPSKLDWDQAKPAARESWERVDKRGGQQQG